MNSLFKSPPRSPSPALVTLTCTVWSPDGGRSAESGRWRGATSGCGRKVYARFWMR
ncbi:hypothetical protein ACLB1E_25435 [Escherichia coli]